MRLVCVSDTHAVPFENFGEIPEGDILVHTGDFSGHGTLLDVVIMSDWFDRLPHQQILVVPGNHDWEMERNWSVASKTLASPKVDVLWDHFLERQGFKIYGTPWQPRFNDWAFNCYEAELEERYKRIPDDTEILLTHCPPFGILDKARNINLGSTALLARVKQLKHLKAHIFGHIHEGYGQEIIDGVRFVNCSLLDGLYQAVNKPIVLEI